MQKKVVIPDDLSRWVKAVVVRPNSRRACRLLTALMLLFGGWLHSLPGCLAQSGASMPEAAQLASQSYDAMQKELSLGSGMFRDNKSTKSYATAWTLSQLLEAELAMLQLTGKDNYRTDLDESIKGLERYWDGLASPPGYEPNPIAGRPKHPDKYYDDNAWLGLLLARSYQLTHYPKQLYQAEEVMTFVQSGWTENETPSAGGIYWTQKDGHRCRNTVSTAGGAELAAQLYMIDGRSDHLEFAKKAYEWVGATLRAPNGLYWDNINPQGQIDKVQYSYNQGLMIGTATLLYKATADRKYLQDAQQLADSSISFYTEHNYSKKELAFNAIFFRNLMLLNSVAPNPEYAKALESYIPQLWSIMDQQNQFLESGRAIDQGAAVQTFATEAIEKLRDATPDRKVGLK